jgi:phosphohistidine phosphatase
MTRTTEVVMDLYLIRHAEAVSRSDPNYSDEDRPLTDDGREQAQALAKALVARGVQFNSVISSPLVRARQTAEEMLQNMTGPLAELEFCRHLVPGGKARKLLRFLIGTASESVALIGHEPELSSFAGRMIGCRRAQIDLAKAGVVLIRFDGPPEKACGTLSWLLTPEWLCAPEAAGEPVKAAGW